MAAKKANSASDENAKEKKSAQINVYVTPSEYAVFEAAMRNDGDDSLSLWFAKIVRLYVRAQSQDREAIRRIEKTVLDIQRRLKTPSEIEHDQ